jgi:GTP cyclohydrolase I
MIHAHVPPFGAKQDRIFSHADIGQMVEGLRAALLRVRRRPGTMAVYPVPRGGIPVAYLLGGGFTVVDHPEHADAIVDDLIDSGITRARYEKLYAEKPFLALYQKTPQDGWITFPWEQGERREDGGEDIVIRLLQYIGEDPKRGGLHETPARVLKAWRHWAQGYGQDPMAVLKTFEDGAEGVDEMVVVRDIPFYSHCEHHLAPFFGTATIAYIPERKIVGLSKLSRLLGIYAHRLQVQERLTNQVADALWQGLAPKGVGVLVRARHLCMESRGICKQGHSTITSALRGVLHDEASARAEFLSLAGASS